MSRLPALWAALLTVSMALVPVVAASNDAPDPGTGAYLPMVDVRDATDAVAFTHSLPGGATHTYWSWGVETLDVRSLWDQGITGEGVKVAVVDTGIDLDHPYFAGRVAWTVSNCDYTTSADDDNGHGTHVAGIVRQMAPNATFYALKVMNEGGTQGGCGNIEATMRQAARGPDGVLGTSDDADVVTVSIGQTLPIGIVYSLQYSPRIQNAMDAGTSFIAAAGNSFVTPGTGSPAGYAEVIAVGALGSYTGNHDLIAEYSSNGITDGDDETISISELEVTAPGTDIVSTWNNGGTRSASGTSMAAPHMAGLVALLKQAEPDLTGDEVRAHLRCASKDLAANGKFTAPGYDVSSGYGLPQGSRLVSGPCFGPVTPTDLAEVVVDTVVEPDRDYDGDGSPDKVDHINDPSESLVETTASDYVELEILPYASSVAVAAPNGQTLTVRGYQALPFRVYFDGRIEGPSSGVTVDGDLTGMPADGTWHIVPSGIVVGETTKLGIAGKTFEYVGWCCGGSVAWVPVPWNWHESGTSTTHVGSLTLPYVTAEQSPTYARYYA